MTILQKLFKKKPAPGTRTVEQIQADANRLWVLFNETIDYYNSVACPCAFPRFSQYTSIDCVDTGSSFYMSETEGFIQNSAECFDVQEVDKGNECYRAVLTCKTCGSTWMKAWSDFSIHVDRNYLKPIEIKAVQIGADPETPIPFVVGLFGHKYPDRSGFDLVSFERFKHYIQALKQG